MNILVGLCCLLMGFSIAPLCGFCFFIAIPDLSFYVIDKGNVVISEMFLQKGEIEVSETLMPAAR